MLRMLSTQVASCQYVQRYFALAYSNLSSYLTWVHALSANLHPVYRWWSQGVLWLSGGSSSFSIGASASFGSRSRPVWVHLFPHHYRYIRQGQCNSSALKLLALSSARTGMKVPHPVCQTLTYLPCFLSINLPFSSIFRRSVVYACVFAVARILSKIAVLLASALFCTTSCPVDWGSCLLVACGLWLLPVTPGC